MSKRLRDNLHFFQLLLAAEKPQQRALLHTLSDSQTLLLSEVIYNFLNNFPIEQGVKKRLNRRAFLRDIANAKRSVKFRKAKLKKHKKDILNLLMQYKAPLDAVSSHIDG